VSGEISDQRATYAAAAAARVRRIDHVGVVVRDIATASQEWAPRLGFTLARVADVLDGTVRLAYLDAGDTTLQLVQPLVRGALTDWLDEHGEGLHHICLEVDTIPAALDVLDDHGPRFIYMGGRDAAVCFIGEKPCNVLVELTEPGSRARTTDPSGTAG
jgi:methylmalonyl-CoA epimerase